MTQISNLKSQISNLKNDKRFITFLVICILFIYTSLLSFSLDVTTKFAAVLVNSFIFVILARYKYFFNVFVLLITIFAAFMMPVTYIYDGLTASVVIAILFTNFNEASEFVVGIPTHIYLSEIAIITFGFLFIKYRKHFIFNAKLNVFLLIIMAFYGVWFGFVKTYQQQLKHDELGIGISSYLVKSRNLVIGSFAKSYLAVSEAVEVIRLYEDVKNKAANWRPVKVNPKFNTYVVVIGESARKDAHQIYGFRIKNTPFLASTPHIQFNDYISPGSHTVESLSNMFLLGNFKDNNNAGDNVLSLAKAAEFETYFFSNQNNIGIFDSLIGGIGSTAHHSFFFNKSSKGERYQKDDVLLPLIQEAVNDKTAKNKVIFVHLMGSHSDFCARTFGEYDEFVLNANLSCYVQSIKQTDKLLGDIYQLLKHDKETKNHSFSLIYFSDHGLSFNKKIGINDKGNNLVHGDHKVNYRVPFVILGSDITANRFITPRRTGMHFMDFFADWLGIEDKLINKKCNFVSDEECINPNDLVLSGNKIGDYSKLPEEEINYFDSYNN